MKKVAAFVVLALGFPGFSPAAEPTRLYLANDDHTDYMWLADEATYDRVFQEMIDFNLRLTERTKENPPPFQHRFNLDGSYWLWAYEKNRTPAEFARVIGALKSGHLSAPLTALVSCYGGQPVEAVLRGMYYAGRLERKHGLHFTQAVAVENRTLPLGLASLWAGSGARYTWRGQCESASRIPSRERDHEIYWATGHDGQRVLMKWHTWVGAFTSGGYAEAFDPRKAVAFLDGDPKFLARYHPPGSAEPYSIRAAFGFGWDALDRKTGEPYPADPKTYPVTEHFHDVAKSLTTAGRQVIVSNQEDFFRDFEAKYGGRLPTDTLAYGNQWDLYSASMAETSSRVRRSVEKLRSAEALSTVVSLTRSDFLRGRETARDQAFMNLGLYWEHDWTADGAIHREDRAAWEEKLAGQIETYVDRLHADAATELGALISSTDSGQKFYAFNPLGWTRTDAADFRYDGLEDIHVRDLAVGADVPHQFERRDGKPFLRILAPNVPAIGYKVFAILPGPGTAPTESAAQVSGPKNRDFENARVRLVLEDDGGIA
ncbi:MAG: glycoside hydrolase, partial [Opitutus sp.]